MPALSESAKPQDQTAVRPIAIGGVGGSGTSVVARIIEAMGIYVGPDLNRSYDNLTFTLLFRRPELLEADESAFALRFAVFEKVMAGGAALSEAERSWVEAFLQEQTAKATLGRRAAWVQERVRHILDAEKHNASRQPWGWKEPNTHIFLDRLFQLRPNLRYVQVLRNGLDVATSANQRQRARWSQRLLKTNFVDSPRQALQYWCAAQRRVEQICEERSKHLHVVRFDDLCQSPTEAIEQLAAFLEVALSREAIATLAAQVRQPSSVGRHRYLAPQAFDACDIAMVEKYGFHVDPAWLATDAPVLDHHNAQVHLIQSNQFAAAQDWDSALASCLRAVSLAPEKPRFCRRLSELYLRVGDLDQGRFYLGRALKLDKQRHNDSLAPYLRIARSLLDDGKRNEAGVVCEAVFHAAPTMGARMRRQFQRFQTNPTKAGPVKAANEKLRPGFLVIGAQRSGTTSLFRLIQSHPAVAVPSKKELHFFDNKYMKGLDWYLDQFPCLEDAGRMISGEATPYYLFHPLCAARVKWHYPNIKLIAILRNPVDRAYSHYKWAVSKGNEPLDFGAALAAEDSRLEGSQELLLKGGRSFSHQKHAYRSRGLYREQLDVWLSQFPRDQFLILQSEKLFTQAQQEMDKVWDFLGLKPHQVEKLPAQKTTDNNGMPPSLRADLASFYHSHNLRLAKLLGDDPGWS